MGKIIAYIVVILIMAALPVLSASAKESESLFGVDEVIKASDMLAQKACDSCGSGSLIACERREVVDGIYEYNYTFSMGPEEFDKMGIHRVVKERQPWKPANTKIVVMMVPGDLTDFRTMYMLSAHPSVLGADVVEPNHSLAIYLAKHGVDVWGIDLRRSFIPSYYPETDTPYCTHPDADNCSFMKDWDMATQLSDLQFATKLAREVRSPNSQKRGDLFMLGTSRGGRLTYAYANAETQQPEKDLKGIITMDIAHKFDPAAEVFYCEDYLNTSTCATILASDAACEGYQRFESLASNGIYYDGDGMSLKGLAHLATEHPDDYDVLPGFTNIEVCELTLSTSYLFMPPPPEITLYHYCAGTFNETGHPTGLVYTNFDYMMLLASNMVSWQSVAYMMDDMAIVCNCSESPYDDHLSEITVPVLYVGGENGYGGYGNYTTTLLGSDDVTIHIVPGHAHVDILYADNAESEVWNPIYEWLVDHKK